MPTANKHASFQEGPPDSIIFVMFPLLYLFREFNNVYTMYRQRHIRVRYIRDYERLFRMRVINMHVKIFKTTVIPLSSTLKEIVLCIHDHVVPKKIFDLLVSL